MISTLGCETRASAGEGSTAAAPVQIPADTTKASSKVFTFRVPSCGFRVPILLSDLCSLPLLPQPLLELRQRILQLDTVAKGFLRAELGQNEQAAASADLDENPPGRRAECGIFMLSIREQP